MIAAIEASRTMPFNKWEVRKHSENAWVLDDSLKPCFSKYYLLYWAPGYFFKRIYDGMIQHDGNFYLVYYHHTSAYSVRKSRQVALSFRKPAPVYDLPAIVLVQGVSR